MTDVMTDALTRELLQRFAPQESRELVTALFTVEREVIASADDALDHSVAHARLAWWQEELEHLARCKARHPATRILADAARHHSLSGLDLRGLLEHARVNLARVVFLGRDELDAHLRHWALAVIRSLMLLGSTRCDGNALADLEAVALRIGCTIREIEYLVNFSRHARHGRIYWPLDEATQDHHPWTSTPLGERESRLLSVRLDTLDRELCAAAAAIPASARAAQTTTLTFAALTRRAAIAARRALPGRSPEKRSEPIRRTIHAWTAAVASGRGRMPRALHGKSALVVTPRSNSTASPSADTSHD